MAHKDNISVCSKSHNLGHLTYDSTALASTYAALNLFTPYSVHRSTPSRMEVVQ